MVLLKEGGAVLDKLGSSLTCPLASIAEGHRYLSPVSSIFVTGDNDISTGVSDISTGVSVISTGVSDISIGVNDIQKV